MDNIAQFAEKYQLARDSALRDTPKGGICGFELEWNLLDSNFSPLKSISFGTETFSFVDFLRERCLPDNIRNFSQLEVFHWMIEWATRPYYTPRRAVYEGRLMEAVLSNALHDAGMQLGQRLYSWHGNLLDRVQVGHQDIPVSWHLAKRRYLERCVDLYGSALATAGIHANLSLPEPLLAWDFMHLQPSERGSRHLDDYKSEFYITSARLLRAFAFLFIATGASTPMEVQTHSGNPVVVLTQKDSVRNLTFPNPSALDVPDLYRSYDDYLQLSYELVRSGIRFGNNNWTPVRARSFAEPVERLILVTSEQLQDLYVRGLYTNGGSKSVEEMARQIEMQNLMARINIPMARVEVRTDDGGQSLEYDIASLSLKHLLMLRFYADPLFARAFRYDQEDLARARRNEEQAAWYGMRAAIENPFTGKMVDMRQFLDWTLKELQPLAEAIGLWEDLAPLIEIAHGAPNTAERLRSRLNNELSGDEAIPYSVLIKLALEREKQVLADVEKIASEQDDLSAEAGKLENFLQIAQQAARLAPQAPIRFFSAQQPYIQFGYSDKTNEIASLAIDLIRIPSVTACPQERLDEVAKAARLVYEYLQRGGLDVRFYDQGRYPGILAGFPGQFHASVMLSGHFDVVEPDPDERQFEPRLEGDYLWGRGAADMKTVVATYLVWMKDRMRQGPPYPPINLLLVGNEENGEAEPMGTPHILSRVLEEEEYAPGIFIAGERTGEHGDELWGEICIQNRGVLRLDVVAHGQRGHSGLANVSTDLSERILATRSELTRLCNEFLTLKSPDGWQSQVRFPFIQVGTPGVYNITPSKAVLGVEIRPIPQDRVDELVEACQAYCAENAMDLFISVSEPGIACDPGNPFLTALVDAVKDVSKQEPRLGRKLPGTSARFAPGGQGIVWGQTGIGPHSSDERHFLPSVLPYYQALQRLSEILQSRV